MKKTFVLFATILNFNLFSQTITYNFNIIWTEQNSGVTSTLNSVSTSLYSEQRYAWICGNNGTVLKTTNDGLNWFNVGINGIPANIDLMNITMLSSFTSIVSGRSGSSAYVYRTSDGGDSWTQVFQQENGFINGIFLNNPFHGFMLGNPVGGRWSIWKSNDGGATWDSAGLYLPQYNNESGWNNSVYSSGYVEKIWFGTNNHKIYYSSNSGLSWAAEELPEQNIYSLSWIGMNLLAGGNNLFASSNYGIAWNQQGTLGTGIINGITAPPLIVIIPEDNIFPSTPWFYIRSGNKIYYTDKGPSNWQIKYQSPSGIYKHINSNAVNVWAVKDNGGITRGKIDVITSVTPNNYPYSFELWQNYPNPFNPKTKIRITIYKTTTITLNIFNSAGKLVWKRANEYIPIQIFDIENYYFYEIEWDGTSYPSGVYYYQVIADDYMDTKKMVLVK